MPSTEYVKITMSRTAHRNIKHALLAIPNVRDRQDALSMLNEYFPESHFAQYNSRTFTVRVKVAKKLHSYLRLLYNHGMVCGKVGVSVLAVRQQIVKKVGSTY